MTGRRRPGPDRRALLAVAATFWVNGVVFSSLFPRYPQLVDQVGTSEGAFGFVLATTAVMGLAGTAVVPVLTRRLGLVRVTLVGAVAVLLAGLALPWAGTVVALAALFGALGFADGLHDVAMNEVAMGEQARRTGSVMGRMHGVWSLGSAIGAGIGAACAALAVPVTAQMMGVVAIAATVQVAASRSLRGRPGAGEVAPEPQPEAATAGPRRLPTSRPAVALIVGLAVLGAVAAEQTMVDWSALLLVRGLDTSAGLGGLGPVVVASSILVGRAVTDPAIDRLGARRVATIGAFAVLLAGMAAFAGAVAGSAPAVLAGLAVAGVGTAPMFPLLFGAADRLTAALGLGEGGGTSLVGFLPRMTGFVLPIGVGSLAASTGLATTMLVVAGGGLIMLVALPRMPLRA